ncbi:hypothetical protein DPMN_004249 [Dreissena polymorpha]|uniref:Uncharacterized protein n=1 Tax=Dreissena polymorpha TaxID=45954 RepID=A0A9D4RSU3_DREPO|nr:hypothetical protein DPMN_004249 [Dreissena polymorpha]
MDLSGIPEPKMDWGSSNLPEAWLHFKDHVDLISRVPSRISQRRKSAHIYDCGLVREDKKYTKRGILHRMKTKI